MDPQDPRLVAAELGMSFFGEVSAGLSHELNNVLAVMKENTGLLQDYLELAAQGRELDQERLAGLAGRLARQVERGRRLVQRMNRFAHSSDQPSARVELGELLELVARLFQRQAAQEGFSLEVVPPPSPLEITTRPFVLENLLWRAMRHACQSGDGGQVLRLEALPREDGAEIRISPWPAGAGRDFPGPEEAALLELLEAGLQLPAHRPALCLRLPGVTG